MSDGKAFEKIFPIEDEEVQEILDGLDHANPNHNQVGHTHFNEHHNNHVAPAYNQVGLAHWNGPHNNHANLPHGGFPIHGGQPMHVGGQPMPFNRGQFPTFVPINNHRIKKSSFKGKLKMWRDQAGSLQLKRS